jgi:hypothetical protein
VNPERLNTLLRDLGSTILGLGGITYQIVTWKISEALLITCAALLGVPGVAGLLSLRSSGGGGTPSSPSPSPPPSPRPPSPPSSPTASVGDR